jgi:hypothetical protein
MQNGVQQRIVNFYLSVVADEPKFAEFVDERRFGGGILGGAEPASALISLWLVTAQSELIQSTRAALQIFQR